MKAAAISPESRIPSETLNPEPQPQPEEPEGGFRKLYTELCIKDKRLPEALTETRLWPAQPKRELE